MLLGIARAELKAPGAARNSASSHSRRRRKSSMSCRLRSPLSRHHGTSRPPPVSSAWSCRPASHLPGPICLGLQQFTRRAALLPCCSAALLLCCSAALLLCCSAALLHLHQLQALPQVKQVLATVARSSMAPAPNRGSEARGPAHALPAFPLWCASRSCPADTKHEAWPSQNTTRRPLWG